MNEREKKVVNKMIYIYCRSKHQSVNGLCNDCESLNNYASERLERCPFGEDKPTCDTCTVHCYKKDMRDRIKEVMRFSGPRMVFIHPIDAIRHLLSQRKKKRY